MFIQSTISEFHNSVKCISIIPTNIFDYDIISFFEVKITISTFAKAFFKTSMTLILIKQSLGRRKSVAILVTSLQKTSIMNQLMYT